jgi:hypothetical protein
LQAEVDGARAEIGDALSAYQEIAHMSSNPDGSLYGTISDAAAEKLDDLAARGVVKKGKSPEEARQEEAQRRAAEQDLQAFLAGDGQGHAAERAERLNHTGTLAELSAATDTAKSDLDSMGDQSELEGMRLQQMMERRSKAIETLTNIMKKMSQTSDSITANLK